MKHEPSANWFTTAQPRPAAEVELFCFPPAGAGASLFHAWPEEVPSRVEVSAVQLPGRERRIREPPFTSMEALVEQAAWALERIVDRPFALFGHSLGGWVCFELARRLQAAGGPVPSYLFVAGCGAPHVTEPNPPIHQLPDDEFLKAVESLNGIPPRALANPELMALALPTLRADFTIYETYAYRDGPPLECPISAFGGNDDGRVRPTALEAWSQQTTGRFELRMFRGDHFFLKSASEEVLRALANDLLRMPAA